MSFLTNKKVSKDQLTKIIQSDGFLGKLLGDLNKKKIDLTVTLTKYVWPKLTTK